MVEIVTLRVVQFQFRMLVATSAIVSLFVIAPVVYMLADNQQPYVYDAERSYAEVHVYSAKDAMKLHVHWQLKTINRVCPGYSVRVIADRRSGAHTNFDHLPLRDSIDLNEGGAFDRVFSLPSGITPGPKWYYTELYYSCNPLQRIYPLVGTTPRLGFEITE